MRKYFVFILVLLSGLLLSLQTFADIKEAPFGEPRPGSSGVGDPYFPFLGNGGYDAQHYTLDLDYDFASNVLAGTVTMQAIATHSLSSFNVDFAGFTLETVTVNGLAARFERQEREVTITPSEPLYQDNRFEVAFTYRGVPGQGLNLAQLPFSGGWNRYARGVYVASEPDGASLWYPVNDHPTDKATYTIIMTVPKPYLVAANGSLQNTLDEGNQQTFIWENSHPTASYLVTVNIAQFTRHDDTVVNGVQIRNYFPSGRYEQGIWSFRNTARMMDVFNGYFGAYPFEAYGAVVADLQLPFALETQTLSLFGINILGGNEEETISHELAHSWFGNHVSPATWRDIWINEGFATYASLLWKESQDGKASADAIASMWERATLRSAVIIGDPGVRNLFSMPVYLKGGLTLHRLRERIGDTAFFITLQTYQARYAYRHARIEDFIAVANEVSGQDLNGFFQAWLFEPGIPSS